MSWLKAEVKLATFPAMRWAWLPMPSMGTPRAWSFFTSAMKLVSLAPE